MAFVKMVYLFALLCSLLAIVACDAFRSPLHANRMFKLHNNVIDGVGVPGDLVPIHNNVLVKTKVIPGKTASGILLAIDRKNEQPSEGEAMAVGPGRHHPETGFFQPQVITPGVNVVFGTFDGAEINYSGAKYHMIKDDDVLFTYKGDVKSLDNIEVCKDQVMYRVMDKDTKTESGIFVADSNKDNVDNVSTVGVVVKVGPGRMASNGQLMPIPVQVGDIIRAREAMAQYIKLEGGGWYTIVRSGEILGRVDNKLKSQP